jgi:hypothetical protein
VIDRVEKVDVSCGWIKNVDVHMVPRERQRNLPQKQQAERALEPHGVDVVEEDEPKRRAGQDGREEDADQLLLSAGVRLIVSFIGSRGG